MSSRCSQFARRFIALLSAFLCVEVARAGDEPLTIVTSEASFGLPALRDDVGLLALSATGGSPPYKFSLAAGALPPGLTLQSGSMSGQYQSPGVWTFALRVTDAKDETAIRYVELDVYPVPRPIPANIAFTISCPYMPRPKWPSHGTEFFLLNNQRNAIKATDGQRVPLLGQYDGTNTEVLDWQVNWATSVGITNFAFNDWWMEGVDRPLYSTSLDAFLACR